MSLLLFTLILVAGVLPLTAYLAAVRWVGRARMHGAGLVLIIYYALMIAMPLVTIWGTRQFMLSSILLNSALFLIVGPMLAGAFLSTARNVHRALSINPEQSRLCGACGYNLTGNVSGVCPECGTVVP